jgi:hypothetical protein
MMYRLTRADWDKYGWALLGGYFFSTLALANRKRMLEVGLATFGGSLIALGLSDQIRSQLPA